MWLVCFRPPARLLPRRGQNRDGAPGCEVQEMRTRWRSFVSSSRFSSWRRKRPSRTHGPDARARAATSFDTPSSGGASVPSRIRPESTVRETPHPVTRALSSSMPRSRSRDFRRICVRAVFWSTAPKPERARVTKHAERRARVPPLDLLRCAHLLARELRIRRRARPRRFSAGRFRLVRTGAPAVCRVCRAIFSYESTVLFSHSA